MGLFLLLAILVSLCLLVAPLVFPWVGLVGFTLLVSKVRTLKEDSQHTEASTSFFRSGRGDLAFDGSSVWEYFDSSRMVPRLFDQLE